MTQIKALLLAAGKGSRLKPFTNDWPKCLMPIGNRPLLEYWLQTLHNVGIKKVFINLHHHSEKVKEFLLMPQFYGWVNTIYEENLLGTAGTLQLNKSLFKNCKTLLIYSDNWCQCDFSAFINYHENLRPRYCPITMMTFQTNTPNTCGIVETDSKGVIKYFHEKIKNPPGNIANGAVYILEPEVICWLEKQPTLNDFSTEVIPQFLGRIATWHNNTIHRDIGHISMLKMAQSDPIPGALWPESDQWHEEFMKLPIHKQIHNTFA
jgi:mannose-1-phosphate guanylyltransferase